METIELTPELVFERVSEYGSPPASMLSYNSGAGRSSLSGSGSSRRQTDTLSSPRSDPTSPRKRGVSPLLSDVGSAASSRNPSTETAGTKLRHDRGYYSLGSGIAKALKKAQQSKASDYGVAISIKGIKGHPFVILEDKEKHRHMVPAPDPPDSASDSSVDKKLPNGHISEPDEPLPKAPPRRAGTLSKDWKSKSNDKQPSSTKPDGGRHSLKDREPFKRLSNGPSTSEKLVKPSDVKAQQKALNPPSSPSMHMRSPRSRTAHEKGLKGPVATRSRSLSPNRALANSKANRSRSMSPPRKGGRGKRVDNNSVQPVSNLIGFFETGQPDSPPVAKPQTRPGRHTQRPRYEKPPNRSSLPSSFDRRPRIDSKEVEVTPSSKKPNLTVTTATAPTKSGSAPAGRYFAITSPAKTSPTKSPFSSNTTPKIVPLKPAEDPSRLSSSTSSSETGLSTDEGTLNIMSDDSRTFGDRPNNWINNLRHSTPQPWQSSQPKSHTTRGVASEALTKPSSISTLPKGFRQVRPIITRSNQRHSNKKPSNYLQPVNSAYVTERTKPSWKKTAERALAKERSIIPIQAKHSETSPKKQKQSLHPILARKQWLTIVSNFNINGIDLKPKEAIKRRWQNAAAETLAREETVVPVAISRDTSMDIPDISDINGTSSLPVSEVTKEDKIIPEVATSPRLLFSSVKGEGKKSGSALIDLVLRMSDDRKKPVAKPTGKVPLVSHLSLDYKKTVNKTKPEKYTAPKKTHFREIVEELVVPERVEKREPPTAKDVTSADATSKAPADTKEKDSLDVPKTVVSKAKIVGPSHQLLKKTRKRRNAQRISTSDQKAYSGSEWSESEYSDADSLGAPLHITDDEMEEEKAAREESETPSRQEVMSPVSTTSTGDSKKSHKRTSSIVFGKISSQDVSKKHQEENDGSSAPSVAELQQHIAQLRGTVRELQATADSNLDNFELLKKLQQKLDAVERENEKLEDEITEGRKILKELEKKLDAAHDEIQAQRQNERRDRIIKQQQAQELSDLRAELSDLGDELEKAKSSSKESKSDEAELTEELERLQRDYDRLLNEQNERDGLLAKRENELVALKKALRDESDAHDEEVEMMRKMHDDLLARLRDELENLRQESVSAVEARPILEEQVSALKEELARLQDLREQETSSSDDEQSSSSKHRAQEEIGRNKKILRKLQEELKAEQTKSANLQHEVNSLQRKLNHASDNSYHTDRIEKLQQELSDVKQEKKMLEGSLASLELQKSTLKNQMQEARQEREDGEREIRTLESDVSRLKGRIQELENETERLKKELNRTRRHLEAQVCDLEHQLTESDRKLSELQAQKANLETSLSEAKVVTPPQSLHDLEQQKLALERALAEQSEMAARYKVEIEELTEELRRMSTASSSDGTNETIHHLEEFKRNAAQELDSLRADVEAKAKALRESDRTNNKLQEELRRMDLELEEELKEREATVAEYKQVERNLHELEARIAGTNREREERLREIEKLQGMLSITEDNKLNLEEKLEAFEDEKREMNRRIHELQEDVKDKEMEIDELKYRVNTAESSPADESRLSELEHECKMAEMQISGLKQALEAKHAEFEDSEDAKKKLEDKLKDSDIKYEDAIKRLRDVEKKRRLAAKEAEDLTIALTGKVAALDEAQRKLRRLDNQMSDMEEAATLATSIRLELDKAKRNHVQELKRVQDELKEANSNLNSTERMVSTLEQELRDYESRYEHAAAESMELERQRRMAANQAVEAQNEARDRARGLARAEERLRKAEEDLTEAEERYENLTNQLRESERRRKDAEVTCSDVTSRLDVKERELDAANKLIKKLNGEMNNASHVSDEARRALVDLEESRKDANEEANLLRSELEDLRRRLQEEEEKVELLRRRLEETDGALRHEHNKANQAEHARDKVTQELNQSRAELAERINALQQTHDSIVDMKHKLTDYEASRNQTSSNLSDAEVDKKEAIDTLQRLTDELHDTRRELRKTEDALAEAEQQFQSTREQVEELQEDLESERRKNKLLKKEVEQLKDQIDDQNQEKKKTEDKKEALENQVSLLQDELKQRADWSDKKVSEMKDEIKKLEKDLKRAEEELERSEMEKDRLEDKLSKIETDGVEEQKENDAALRKEMQQLRDTLDDRTQQVYAAEDTIYRQKEVIEELTSLQQTAEKSSLEQMEAYMGESDKQFEQLKSLLQERSEQLKKTQGQSEALEKEVEALTCDLERATSDAQRTRSLHQEEQRKLEEVDELLVELRKKLKEEQRENDELRKEISSSQRRPSDSSSDAGSSKHLEELEELQSKFQEAEEEKEEAMHKLNVLMDQIGQLHSELEMKKSQVEVLQSDMSKQKKEIGRLNEALESRLPDGEQSSVEALQEKIAMLEEKLQQEANELNAIDTHHRKTEMKLREVLEQAEIETNKANNEKEMMGIRAKSLKQQLSEAEQKLAAVDAEKRQLAEMLQEEKEANFELRKTIHLRLPNSNAKAPPPPPSGNLFTSV
uniref:ELKS/Rab6-interacting/CAST family member 1-like n=1 Tax=Phallusia mammillata TaxID=59560 RepID=A0A6F9DBE9_9ASCI|nr:ELKS/Rab6-interacting/CAST family member 1-like [Phallusia mammillata]